MIYVNQVGGQDDLVFDGGSFVVDRDGTLLERSPMFMEHLGLFDLDTDAEHQTTGDIADLPDPDEEVYTACVLGLKDYMAKNRFSGVCLGLSGGIDSALVAAMAADACGGHNVHGISMPSMYSSIGSKDDAADLAANIGAHYDVQPIEPMFNVYQGQLKLEGVAAENLQARIRGVIVMAYSNSSVCSPSPRATSPSWRAAIRPSTATPSADTRRSRTCSRPVSGNCPAGATGPLPQASASAGCASSAMRTAMPERRCPAA